jgi:cytochrome c oxidase subunit III
MNPFKVLAEKPWLPQAAAAAQVYDIDPNADARVALRFFIAVVCVLFFLFTITFLARSQYPDFQALASQPWQPFSDTSRLWFNTALLALSSLALQLSGAAATAGKLNRTIIGVSAASFFAVLFILAQLDLWQQFQSMGFYVSSNPANSYFYLFTAVHGLHLIGGLIALGNVALRLWSDSESVAIGGSLKLCSTYWHFLLAIWLLLFALLTSSPETINALAAMCGF